MIIAIVILLFIQTIIFNFWNIQKTNSYITSYDWIRYWISGKLINKTGFKYRPVPTFDSCSIDSGNFVS